MPNRPKKQSDIVLVGTGPLIDAINTSLNRASQKIMTLPDASKAHFLRKGVIVYDGEKIASKHFFVLLPSQLASPTIRGIETTKHRILDGAPDSTLRGDICIVGSGSLAIQAAFEFATTARSVSLIYPGESMLPDFDVSLQEVITRQLRKLKVKLMPSHSVIASLTKSGKTYLLLKAGNTSKKIVCDELMIEQIEVPISDIGLDNYNGYASDEQESVIIQHGLIVVRGKHEITNLTDALRYAVLLQGRRLVAPPTRVNESSFTVSRIELFSFGVLEQDFIDTHIGYKKAIAKFSTEGSDITGFIKVISSLKGKIVGITGIVPSNYSGVDAIRFAVKNQIKFDNLLHNISVADELMNAYMELSRDLR